MKYIILVLVLIIAGCVFPSGAKISSEHGYCIQGQYDDGRFAGAGCPTIVPDGASPMGSRSNTSDGVIVTEDMFSTIVGADGSSATGPAAIIVAETRRLEQLLLICAVAPTSMACSGQ